jgi:hypothetical protein
MSSIVHTEGNVVIDGEEDDDEDDDESDDACCRQIA